MREYIWNYLHGSETVDPLADSMRAQILQAPDRVPAAGTTYYFSSVNGNDSNDGKSPETALRTPERVADLPLQPDDAVLFERGSEFRLTQGILLTSGVYYGAYGQGEKPKFIGSAHNYGRSGCWTACDTEHIWQMTYAYAQPGQIILNDGELVGNRLFDRQALRQDGDYYFDKNSCIIYLYSDTDPNTYERMEISCGGNGFGGKDVRNVTVENLWLQHFGCHGIGFWMADHVTVRHCVFRWIGGDVQRPTTDDITRLGNAVEFYDTSNNITVEDNWIYQIYDTGITFQGTQGPFTNIQFNNNLIEYCVMGIEYWCGNKQQAMRAVFDGNILRFSNYGWGTLPDRVARGGHLWAGWRLLETNKEIDIVIRNNVFDCSYSYVFSCPWKRPEVCGQTYTFEGNSYYMRNRIDEKGGFGVDVNMAFFFGPDAVRSQANNQAELEAAVKAVDPHAKEIRWLD